MVLVITPTSSRLLAEQAGHPTVRERGATMSDILDRMLADDGDPWTARQVAKINRLGCPLEDCPGSVPWVGDVEAALHVHFAECHRQLIDRKHDGPWALFIAEHVQAAAKVCAA